MCSYLNLIEIVVNDLVKNKMMFTAFNVTNQLRIGWPATKVYHTEVRKEVYQMFEDGKMLGYIKSLANLLNLSLQPWIYHPVMADFSQYTGSPTPSFGVGNRISVDDSSNDVSDVVSADTSDRLGIPSRLIRQLGLKRGDLVGVYQQNRGFEVLLKQNNDLLPNWITSYVVDKDENVRISKSLLNKEGLIGPHYRISGDKNSISIIS